MGSEEAQAAPRRSSHACRRVWTTCTAVSLIAAVLYLVLNLWPSRTPHAPALNGSIVLRNRAGVEVHVLQTGASLHRLLLPDRDGRLADVALGMATERAYADGSSPYFGAVVGRFANRIANATFRLDGQEYNLHTNEQGFPGSLHGGVRGFDKVRWETERIHTGLPGRASVRGKGVRLSYRSVDGEEGYPGTLDAEVRVPRRPHTPLAHAARAPLGRSCTR
jgi:hypothetical protein